MKLRYKLFLLFFCLLHVSVYPKTELKALTDHLDHLVVNKHLFTEQKEQKIDDLRRLLNISGLSPEQMYEINQKLVDEYKNYLLDSAIYYTKKNLQIAEALGKESLIYKSKLQLAPLYSCIGMYRESEDILKSIRTDILPDKLHADYFESYCQFFKHYKGGMHYKSKVLVEQEELYRDSLLTVLEPSSYMYKINLAIKYTHQGQVGPAREILLNLLETGKADSFEHAMITYYLGTIGKMEGDLELEKKYYTLSAIADLKSSIKENASFQSLALIYYEAGDIGRAFRYAQSAIEDAVFCNVQFRTAQMSKLYSIINAAYQAKESKAKSQLLFYIILISLLSLFLILLVVFVYRQVRKISVIKEELADTNGQLTLLNEKLNMNNDQLHEANYIKEQYIARFFDICSSYINKMEDNRKALYKIAINKQFDELVRKLKSTTLFENETEELYKYFDSIFLSIYPTFVTEFNSLLMQDEQIILKSDDLLNTELRIYALLRLGITDSTKIASFLRCSMSTVYNYRTKMRNKASISRDEFENRVMNIGEIRKK